MKRLLINLGLAAAILVVSCLLAGPSIKRRLESANCGNYMASIGIAARVWSEDHEGHFPTDLGSLSNEISNPMILICPADHSRQPATNWSAFTTNNTSYEIVTPGLRDGNTNGVFLRCKIHGHLGYTDGTVFDGKGRRTKGMW